MTTIVILTVASVVKQHKTTYGDAIFSDIIEFRDR